MMCKESQKRKFGKLFNHAMEDARACCPKDKWVVNLHPRPLSTAEVGVLAKA